MRVIARRNLVAFAARRGDSRRSLEHWLAVVRAAEWKSMSEVRHAFSKAKALNGDRVRFEIQGGEFRLIAAFDFRRQVAFVKFIGTHADYDRIDARTVSQF